LSNLSATELDNEPAQPEVLTAQSISYAFAKRHGVMLGQLSEDSAQLFYRGELNPQPTNKIPIRRWR